MVLNVFTVFTKCFHKLKQGTNLRLHDENYASLICCLINYSSTKWGGGGAYSRGDVDFKFWPIEGAFVRRGRLFERVLIRRFKIPIHIFFEVFTLFQQHMHLCWFAYNYFGLLIVSA